MIKAACARTGAIHVQKDLSFPLRDFPPPLASALRARESATTDCARAAQGREKEAIIEAVEAGLPSNCKLAVGAQKTPNPTLPPSNLGD